MVTGEPADDFYEASRRNVAVLLLFWLSYIVSYLLLARSITLPSASPTAGYVRKRRSNLSRLMLLGRPKSRPRSMPPRHASDSPVHGRTFSLGQVSEISTQSDDDGRSPVADDGPLDVALLGQHLLSSFSLEYTVTVFGLSLVIQLLCVLPVSVWGLRVLAVGGAKKGPHLGWLSTLLLKQWLRWLWACALGTLFIGIPLALFLRESREHRDALGFKKVSILAHRLLACLARRRLVRPLGAALLLVLLYLASTVMGITSPIKLSEWELLLNMACMSLMAPLSLVAIPLGIRCGFRGAHDRFISSQYQEELQEHIQTIETQIGELREALSGQDGLARADGSGGGGVRKRRVSGGESTPVSSKSLRSKLVELEFKLEGLRERAQYERSPFWGNLRAIGYLLLYTGSFLYILYTQLGALLGFTSRQLLWYIPGIQLIDRLLYAVARVLYLVAERHQASDAIIRGEGFVGTWTRFVLVTLMLTTWLYLGLGRIASRRAESTVPVVPLHPLFGGMTFRLPRRSLDRALRVVAVALVSTALFVPLLNIAGVLDGVDPFLVPSSQCLYYSPLISLLPNSLERLVAVLERPTVLYFPLFLWLILAYRLLLFSLTALIGIQSLRSTWHHGKGCMLQSIRLGSTKPLYRHE